MADRQNALGICRLDGDVKVKWAAENESHVTDRKEVMFLLRACNGVPSGGRLFPVQSKGRREQKRTDARDTEELDTSQEAENTLIKTGGKR